MALASKKAATSKPTTRATGKRQKATQDEDSDEEVPKSVKKKKGDEEGGDGVKIECVPPYFEQKCPAEASPIAGKTYHSAGH